MIELYSCMKCGVTTVTTDGHCSRCGRKAKRVNIITSGSSGECYVTRMTTVLSSATNDTYVIVPIVVTGAII